MFLCGRVHIHTSQNFGVHSCPCLSENGSGPLWSPRAPCVWQGSFVFHNKHTPRACLLRGISSLVTHSSCVVQPFVLRSRCRQHAECRQLRTEMEYSTKQCIASCANDSHIRDLSPVICPWNRARVKQPTIYIYCPHFYSPEALLTDYFMQEDQRAARPWLDQVFPCWPCRSVVRAYRPSAL